jgi:hypothetical protein
VQEGANRKRWNKFPVSGNNRKAAEGRKRTRRDRINTEEKEGYNKERKRENA